MSHTLRVQAAIASRRFLATRTRAESAQALAGFPLEDPEFLEIFLEEVRALVESKAHAEHHPSVSVELYFAHLLEGAAAMGRMGLDPGDGHEILIRHLELAGKELARFAHMSVRARNAHRGIDEQGT